MNTRILSFVKGLIEDQIIMVKRSDEPGYVANGLWENDEFGQVVFELMGQMYAWDLRRELKSQTLSAIIFDLETIVKSIDERLVLLNK